MGVKVNQGDRFAKAAHKCSQIGGHGAFADAAFLAGDQNFKTGHSLLSDIDCEQKA